MVFVGEWCRHGDDKGVRRLRFGSGAERAIGNRVLDNLVQVRLDNMNLATVDHIDDVGIGIDADDIEAPVGEDRRRRQPDIAEPDHRKRFEFLLSHGTTPRRYGPPPYRRHRGYGRGSWRQRRLRHPADVRIR